jgi:hypothetical protein
MPQFFFQVRIGADLIADPGGSDLPNLSAAKSEALADLRNLVADRVRCGRPLTPALEIEIADHTGQTLATVGFEDVLKGLH